MFLRSRRRTRVASFAILLVLQARPSCQALGIGKLLSPGGAERRSEDRVSIGTAEIRGPALFLLAGDRLRLALAGAGVGVGALAAHRELPPVAQPAIGPEIHQALDVHRDLAAEAALDDVVAVDRLADLQDLGIGQLVDAALG